ncbi:MAG: helix-turn-helix domain-containing protein [Actinomycetota bacterium]|nr:helix-turn-helix domain-containing protein [Actinomycetota bacterium]
MEILDADAVAEMIGMSKDWIYAEARADRIPHIKMGRYTRFRREAIEDWIRERERGKIAQTS